MCPSFSDACRQGIEILLVALRAILNWQLSSDQQLLLIRIKPSVSLEKNLGTWWNKMRGYVSSNLRW